jgi:predicted O-methyltransferase YrrM
MIAYGRRFRPAQLARVMTVLGSAASPLLLKALRNGPQAAFEFSARAAEVCNEITEHDEIRGVTVGELTSGRAAAGEIWLDLSAPSSEMPPGELATLCALARILAPRCVVEIGTASGWTTRHLSRNTPADCRLYTVDLPPANALDAAHYSDPHLVRAAGKAVRDFGADPKITQILHDSTTLEWAHLLDRPVDLALVDGSHLYEHVRADTECLWNVLAHGAVVLWHDYATVEVRRGVRKYLLELRRSGLAISRLAGTHFGAHIFADRTARRGTSRA